MIPAIPYRSLALAYEADLGYRWRRIVRDRQQRDQARARGDLRNFNFYREAALANALELRELLEIRKAARHWGCR